MSEELNINMQKPNIANPELRKDYAKYQRDLGNTPVPPEKFYRNYMFVSADAAATYGNVVAGIENFICGLFPPDTFQTVSVATTMPHRQMTSTPKQLMKKRPPMLVLNPRIDFGQDGDRFLANTMIAERIYDIKTQGQLNNLQAFIEDPRAGFQVEWQLNRLLMNVEVLFVFNTYNEQVNWMHYLYNSTRINRPFLINMPLESLIPKPLINQIAEFFGIPVYNEIGSVGPFLQRLQSVSKDPITYKMKTSSRNDEFFRYYGAQVDCKIDPPTDIEPQIVNNLPLNYAISTKIRCEFNAVGHYFLTSDRLKRSINVASQSNGAHIATLFTDDIDLRKFDIPNGWAILATPIVRFGPNDKDGIDFDCVLDGNLTRMISYFLTHGMNPELIMQFRFRIGSKVVHEPPSFHIDWSHHKIMIDNPNEHFTYRLLITVNNEYINNLTMELFGLEKYNPNRNDGLIRNEKGDNT
jgi:hypothetical protein